MRQAKERELLNTLKDMGIDVHTSTKARGHQGFYLRNRIDVSKDVNSDRFMPTLLHEFAHYVHAQMEPDMSQTGGTLEKLFDTSLTKELEKELIAVTGFVDMNSKLEKLEKHKRLIKNKISEYETIIKSRYPKFMRSKKFKEFDRYIKKSNARYLLKYDRIKLITGFLFKKVQLLTIDNIEQDFCSMPPEFAAYIRLRSCQKRQSKISGKINKLKKYYTQPTELFARFIEGLYIDQERVKHTAPQTYKRFYELLEIDYYKRLSPIIEDYIPKSL